MMQGEFPWETSTFKVSWVLWQFSNPWSTNDLSRGAWRDSPVRERETYQWRGKEINWSLDNILEGERGQDIKILSPAIFYFYPDFAGGENDSGKGPKSREMTFVIHHCSAWVLEHCQNWRHRWTQIIENSVPNLFLAQRDKVRWQGLRIRGWTNLR